MRPAGIGTPPPRPVRRSGGAKVGWMVIGLVVLGCCGTGAVGLVFVGMIEGEQETATAAERDMLLTVEDVSPYLVGGVARTPTTRETLEKRSHFDGATELFYEYDDADAVEGIYLTSGINVDPSPSDARFTYTGMKMGASLGLAMEGDAITQQERDDLLSWGDESRCTLLVNGGVPVGNFFIARKGRRVFHLVLAGVYFDDPVTFQELVLPHLESMERYAP